MRVNFKQPYMIKGVLAILALWDFNVKIALYYQKCFSTITAEILESVEQLPLKCSFLKHTIFLHTILRQAANPLGIKLVLIKILNCHILLFEM